ncbi:MAG: M20 family metallo-hydrolase [Chloroflexota bacterium]
MMTLTIDSDRIESELKHLATFSDAPPPAITRVLFTETELRARNYIRELMKSANLEIREDAVGNIFGRWIGSQHNLPAVATGSHIDAIPFSGMYDGTVGVIGAIEAVRALQDANNNPQRSIEIIMFTSEEPTRFGLGCLGSRAMAGVLSKDDLLALRDADDMQFDEVRQQAGYTQSLETVIMLQGTYHAFVELHIEQGTRLENSGNTIGIVTAIAAPATLRIVIQGDGGHAGAVLMPNRRDALPAVAEIVLAVEKIAQLSGSPDSVATVGLVDVYPNAVNSIPSRVLLEIDIRDIDLETRDAMVVEIQSTVNAVCENRQLSSEITILNADKPCHAGATIVETVEAVTKELNYSSQKLVSRAYHDALFMAQICPTSMIFVPSENGYSHRPEEFTSLEDITKGVKVLAHTLAHLSTQT